MCWVLVDLRVKGAHFRDWKLVLVLSTVNSELFLAFLFSSSSFFSRIRDSEIATSWLHFFLHVWWLKNMKS